MLGRHLATDPWTTALFTDHVLCAFGRATGTWDGEGGTRTMPATGRWLTDRLGEAQETGGGFAEVCMDVEQLMMVISRLPGL